MALDFKYNDRVAGYFVDIAGYPRAAGVYRYMPYRSVGHYELALAWQERGEATCTYATDEGEVHFAARFGTRAGELTIVRVSETPAKPKSES